MKRFDVVNNDASNGDDYPTAISSIDVAVEGAPYRRLAITGATTRTGGNVDLFNLSYDAERQDGASCAIPAVGRLPLWAASPANWGRPDGDNFDAGVGVHILQIGGDSPLPPPQRAIFVVARYVGATVNEEWAILRIAP